MIPLFECKECQCNISIKGFDICAACGWSGLGYNVHANLLQEKYKDYWREMPVSYWIAKLVQEVGEAAAASVGDHKDPLEWELIQIKAICGNMLDMLQSQRKIRPGIKKVNK